MSDKGRLTVPSDIREAAGLSHGGELIARATAEGTVVLETREAIMRRIREAAPPAPAGGWPIEAWDREDREEDEVDDAEWRTQDARSRLRQTGDRLAGPPGQGTGGDDEGTDR